MIYYSDLISYAVHNVVFVYVVWNEPANKEMHMKLRLVLQHFNSN